jgi:hypothetical protein
VGFPSGAVLDKIHNYYWNVGLWLSRPATIQSMAYRALHGLIYTGPFRELTAEAATIILGGAAVDALGRRASQCTVTEFVDSIIDKGLQEVFRFPRPLPDPPPFRGLALLEEFALGGVVKTLLAKYQPIRGRPKAAPEEKEIRDLVHSGVQGGVREMIAFEKASMAEFEKLMQSAAR